MNYIRTFFVHWQNKNGSVLTFIIILLEVKVARVLFTSSTILRGIKHRRDRNIQIYKEVFKKSEI